MTSDLLTVAPPVTGAPKRVLVIAMHYPPMRGVGTLRVAGFVRHFREFGWEPTVVTVNDAHLDTHCDTTLVRLVPDDIPVVRITSPEYYAHSQLRALTRRLRRHAAWLLGKRPSESERGSSLSIRAWWPAQLLASSLDWIFLPRSNLPWALAVGARAISLAAASDLILSSALPMGCHLAAGYLARRTKRPWIADYRDLYTFEFMPQPSQLHARIAWAWEHWTICRADRVVTTTDTMTRRVVEMHGVSNAERVVTITNGYDRELVRQRRRSAEADKREFMRISRVGRAYDQVALPTLLRAWRSLIDAGEIQMNHIQLEIVGPVVDDQVAQVRALCLSEACVFRGVVPQANAFQAMLDADVLFVAACDAVARYCVRAKIFEYMQTGNPILAVADEGPMRRIIVETRVGIYTTPGDVEATKEALSFYYRLFREGRLRDWARQARIEAFDRRVLTARLVREMDALVGRV